jgi:hypothetical protein
MANIGRQTTTTRKATRKKTPQTQRQRQEKRSDQNKRKIEDEGIAVWIHEKAKKTKQQDKRHTQVKSKRPDETR